jgi:hypothetical protein
VIYPAGAFQCTRGPMAGSRLPDSTLSASQPGGARETARLPPDMWGSSHAGRFSSRRPACIRQESSGTIATSTRSATIWAS